MKKQSLICCFLLLISIFFSLNSNAAESQNKLTNLIFSDAELSKLLNVRPFSDQQKEKAIQRLYEVSAELIANFFNEKIPVEDRSAVAGCIAKMTTELVTSTQAFEKRLAKPEQITSDYFFAMTFTVCSKGKVLENDAGSKPAELSVNDLLLDFTAYYGKEVVVKGYIVYNDMGSYLFHSKGNMNAVFLNNDRLSRESKKYLMGCGGGCEVTLKVRPSQEDSILMKTAYALSLVK